MSYRLGPYNLINGDPFTIDTQVNADLQQALLLKNESQMTIAISGYGNVEEDLVPGEHMLIMSQGSSAKMDALPSFPGYPQTGIANILYATLYLKGEILPQPGYSKVVNRATSKSSPKLLYLEANGAAGVALSLEQIPPAGKTAYLVGILATGGVGSAPNNTKINVNGTFYPVQFWVVENTTNPIYFREEFAQALESTNVDGSVQVVFNAGTGPHTLLIWGYNQ